MRPPDQQVDGMTVVATLGRKKSRHIACVPLPGGGHDIIDEASRHLVAKVLPDGEVRVTDATLWERCVASATR